MTVVVANYGLIGQITLTFHIYELQSFHGVYKWQRPADRLDQKSKISGQFDMRYFTFWLVILGELISLEPRQTVDGF